MPENKSVRFRRGSKLVSSARTKRKNSGIGTTKLRILSEEFEDTSGCMPSARFERGRSLIMEQMAERRKEKNAAAGRRDAAAAASASVQKRRSPTRRRASLLRNQKMNSKEKPISGRKDAANPVVSRSTARIAKESAIKLSDSLTKKSVSLSSPRLLGTAFSAMNPEDSWSPTKKELHMFRRSTRMYRQDLAQKMIEEVKFITVHVRDLVFTLKPKKASQNFKWVGKVAALRYAKHSRLLIKPDELIVADVKNEKGLSVRPYLRIKDVAWNEACFTVELKRFKQGQSKTEWQCFAETDPKHYKQVTVVYSGVMPKDDSRVLMWSNSNHYRYSYGMETKKKDRKAYCTIKVPKGIRLKFFFDVGREKQLSPNYESCACSTMPVGISLDQNFIDIPESYPADYKTQEVNLLAALNTSTRREWNNLVSDEISKVETEEKRTKRWEYKVPGLPEGDNLEKLFLRDWRDIQLNDVIPSARERTKIREVLERNWNTLQQIFRYNSAQQQPVEYMGQMAFVNMIGQLKIYNKNLTPSDAVEIFVRVNVPEDYGSDDDLEGIGNLAKGGYHIVEKEDNPDTLFVRSEFMEALVRVSLRRYPDDFPATAFTMLVERHVIPKFRFCVEEIESFRQLMETPEVKKAFTPHLEKLYKKVFMEVAGLDSLTSNEQQSTISFREYASWLRYKGLLSHKGCPGLTRRQASLSFALPIEPEVDTCALPELRWDSFLETLTRIARTLYVDIDDNVSIQQAVESLCQRVIGRGRRSNGSTHLALHHGVF